MQTVCKSVVNSDAERRTYGRAQGVWEQCWQLVLANLQTLACVQGCQVDWEAILSRSPEPFVVSVSAWLYPPAARDQPAAQPPRLAPDLELEQLPLVKQLLGTARWRLEALNMP